MASLKEIALSLGLTPDAIDPDLEAELLASESLAGGESRTAPISGTKALMVAVLEDAIRCYLDGGKRLSEEAEGWIQSNRRGSPFCFAVVCETLHLNPHAVRRSLKHMKQEKVSSRAAIPRARNNVRVPGRVCSRKLAPRSRSLRRAS
jgi:hypothetical protein